MYRLYQQMTDSFMLHVSVGLKGMGGKEGGTVGGEVGWGGREVGEGREGEREGRE